MLLDDKSPGFLYKFSKLFIQEYSLTQDDVEESLFVDPYSDYTDYADQIFSFMKEKGVRFAGSEGEEQAVFLYEFIRMNSKTLFSEEKIENLDVIKLPELRKYQFDIELDMVSYRTEIWEHTFTTYLQDEQQIKDSIDAQRNNGDLSPYDGNLTYDDTYDSETREEKVTNFKRIG